MENIKDAHADAYARTSLAPMYAYAYAYAFICICIYISYACICTYIYMHMHRHAFPYMHMYAYANAYTYLYHHTHSCANTNTSTHMCTQAMYKSCTQMCVHVAVGVYEDLCACHSFFLYECLVEQAKCPKA